MECYESCVGFGKEEKQERAVAVRGMNNRFFVLIDQLLVSSEN